jgi:hypothetical protein
MGGECSMHERGQKKKHTAFWLENLKRQDHSEEFGVNGKIILEWILRK